MAETDEHQAEPEGGPFERQRIFFEERFTPLQAKGGQKKLVNISDAPLEETPEKPVVATRGISQSVALSEQVDSPPISPNFRQKLIKKY